MRLSVGVPVPNRDPYRARATLNPRKTITRELTNELVVDSAVSLIVSEVVADFA